MTLSLFRKAAVSRPSKVRRTSDVGLVLAICIGTAFLPVIGLCAAALTEAVTLESASTTQTALAAPAAP